MSTDSHHPSASFQDLTTHSSPESTPSTSPQPNLTHTTTETTASVAIPSITYLTPKTMDELLAHWGEVLFLHQFVPHPWDEESLMDFLKDHMPHHTLVHVDGKLFGMFSLALHTRSAELHGIVRGDAAKEFPEHYKQLKLLGILTILNHIFFTLNKHQVIMKAFPENKGVLGLARMFGFHRLQDLDRGRIVWILKRNHYEIVLSKLAQSKLAQSRTAQSS